MANQFSIEPANPLQALMMGVQGYDRAQKGAQQEALRGAREQAGQLYAQGGDTRGVLGQLIGLGDAETVKALGSMGPKETDDQREYGQAVKQGFKGTLMDYVTAIKRAGANQNTINMPPQEKAYDSAMGKELAELNVGIIKGGATASNNLATINRLDQLLADPSVYQGTAGEKVLQAKRLAKSIGIDVGDVGPAEAAQAITAQLALNARSPAGGAGMPGAMSDADREYLKSMQPGIERTDGGNKIIIDTNRKINQRSLDVDRFRQDYIRRNGRLNEGFYRELADWSNKNPLFAQSPAPAVPAPAGAKPPARMRYNPATGNLE